MGVSRDHLGMGGRCAMKLYWRYKKDGKWTWKPVGEEASVAYAVLSMGPDYDRRHVFGEEE